MKIKVQMVEGFHTTIWKEPIEINTDEYPELEGMSEDEALEYIQKNAIKMKGDPKQEGDADDWSIWDEVNSQDVEFSKEKNFESSIELWTE